MPRRRRLSREEIEARFETAGGFMIPLRLSRRAGLIWVGVLALISILALVGGLPGGTGSVDLRKVLQPFPAAARVSDAPPRGPGAVAEDVQELWRILFRQAGETFTPAKIVIFDESATTDCVDYEARPLAGTFYCHADRRFLVDRRLTSSYAVAHGYAHHVQELLGITDQIARAAEASPSQARDLWRRHELQGDCLAGVWAYRYMGPGTTTDLADAPDHFIERRSWTVPSRDQRDHWYAQGLEGGDPSACDTFSRDA